MKKRKAKTSPGSNPGRSQRDEIEAAQAEEYLHELAALCKKARGVKAWEVYLESEHRTAIEAKQGKVDSMVSAHTLAAAVRLVVDGHMGFSFTNDFSRSALRKMVSRAREVARHLGAKSLASFVPPPSKGFPRLDIRDPSFSARGEEDKIKKALAIEQAALCRDPKIKRVRAAEFEESLRMTWLLNSEGLSAKGGATLYTASLEAVAEERGQAQSGEEFESNHHYDRLDVERVGERAADKALKLLAAGKMGTGKVAAVISPEAAAGLLSVFAPAAFGDAVLKGRSWLRDKRGKTIASQVVNIVDDALMEEGPSAFPFDDEGTASRRVWVVKEGVLANFLYDEFYGRLSGEGSTGNGLRPSIAAPPAVDNTNLVILPGARPETDLIKEVERGVYIIEFMGLHTADAITGEFSLGAAGVRIEKGKLSDPVKGFTVAGTIGEVLFRVEEAANQVKFVGDTGSPALLVGELDLSAS